MTDAVTRAVEGIRLCVGPDADATRVRFSVARAQALEALRARDGPRWAFSLHLIRAARAYGESAEARVFSRLEDDVQRVTFEFSVPEFNVPALRVAGFLEAALSPFAATQPAEARCTWALARGINSALGLRPRQVVVRTPDIAWTYARASGRQGDRYREFERGERFANGFAVEVALERPTFGRALRSLLGGETSTLESIAEAWSCGLGRPHRGAELGGGVSLDRTPCTRELVLGDVGKLRLFDPGAERLSLTREGVRVCGLEDLLQRHGVVLEELAGHVESDQVAIDIAGRRVVADQRAARLVAWLAEVGQLHNPQADPFPPDHGPDLITVTGARVPPSALASALASGEWTYVWRHQGTRSVAESDRRILALWPSELRRLEDEHRITPHWAMRAAADAVPFDPTALLEGCFTPCNVALPDLDVGADVGARVLVHRYAAASGGGARVVAWGHEVARFDADVVTIRGVTILVDIEPQPRRAEAVAALVQDRGRLRDLVARVCDAAWDRIDELEAVAWGESGGGSAASLRVPLLAWRLELLDASSIGLRYEVAASGRLALAWDDAVFLGLTVATTRDGRSKTLLQALQRLASVGGIVVGDSAQRWVTLESDAELLEPWVLTEKGRAWLGRVVGPRAIWAMPVATAAMPSPRSAADQPHLMLTPGRVIDLRNRRRTDARSAEALRGHLLVARVSGGSDCSLGESALFHTFDPRALSGRGRMSLDAIIAGRVNHVAPFGAVSRSQPRVTIEATPAVAALLHELGCATPAPAPTRKAGATAVQPVASSPEPALARLDPGVVVARESVVDRLCVGSLVVTSTGSPQIELWAKGLRVGEFRLPRPLRVVAGRLWLTDAGIRAGHAGIVKVALAAGARLQQRAEVALRLSLPGSERIAVLAAFVGASGQVPPPSPRGAVTPLRVAVPPGERLSALLRHALARQVQLEQLWLSWKVAKFTGLGSAGKLELGKRNALVRQALAEDASWTEVCAAAIVIVSEVIRAVPTLGDADVAIARILATARYAAAPTP